MYRLPLFDHRAIDLMTGSAAYAGRLLGDMGAEVIKVEPPGGDPMRGTDQFEGLNANKYGCVLDPGSDLVERLAALADVVIAPVGAVDAADLRSLNDGVIIVLLSHGAGPVECVVAAGAVGLALWDKRRTGAGGVIEVNSLDGAGLRAALTAPTEPVSTLGGVVEVPSSPLNMSETPLHVRLPAPALGEHNAYVFEHLLGGG